MFNLKTEYLLKIILIFSIIALISAYFIEYVLGHQPCNLCLIGRIPYVLSIILIISNYILRKNEKIIILLLILTFVFSFFISIYHFGIEQGFFEESAICGLKNSADIITKDELLKIFNEINVSCKDVTFRVFGLSLTTVNICLSLFLIILSIKNFTNYEKF